MVRYDEIWLNMIRYGISNGYVWQRMSSVKNITEYKLNKYTDRHNYNKKLINLLLVYYKSSHMYVYSHHLCIFSQI